MQNITTPTPCDEYQLNPKKLITHLKGKDSKLEKQAIDCLLSKIIPKVKDLYGFYVEDATIREKLNNEAIALFLKHLRSGKFSIHDDLKTLTSLCLQEYVKPKYLKWCQEDYTNDREKFLKHLLADKKMAMDCIELLAHPEVMRMRIMQEIELYDEKEEVFQEALIGFSKSLKNSNYKADIQGKSLVSYFKGIAYRKAVDFLRKRKPTDSFPEYNELDNYVNNETELIALKECVEQLPPNQKIVVNAKNIDDWSHIEIAEELGISESSSQNLLHKAIQNLKKCMKSKGFNR